jgi:tRNA U34 5-methylaminomethyl-2-thiouridine-forming methyltransferase MnmC
MEIELQTTADGSHTLFVPELNEHYHSTFGAIQESRHVFVESGFRHLLLQKKPINLLEVGFGTGLNALLTLLEKDDINVNYTAIEAFPPDRQLISQLNYHQQVNSPDATRIFRLMHDCGWGEFQEITDGFCLKKILGKIEEIELTANTFDLVYFDAFAPDVQPQLWTAGIFSKLHRAMTADGVLVTYSSKGLVKRNLTEAGFTIERLPGPPGKRHMLRASK